MTATQELEQLRQAVAEQRAAQREAELEAGRARQTHEDARRGLVEGHAEGDAKRIRGAQAAVDRAHTAAEDAEARLEGAELRVARAQAEAASFEGQHTNDLLAEQGPDADRAVAQLGDALGALVAADQLWRSVAANVNRLVVAAGSDPQREAHDRHGVEEIVRAARRALESVDLKSPLPHWTHVRWQEQEAKVVTAIRERRKRPNEKLNTDDEAA